MTKRRHKKPIRRFFSLSRREKSLFFEAISWAIAYRTITFTLPFRLWRLFISKKTIGEPLPVELPKNVIIQEIFRAMRRSSVYLPFKEKCLIEALVMKKMLYKRNISSILFLGLAKDEQNKLIAHAWLMHENEILSGRKNANQFVEINRIV